MVTKLEDSAPAPDIAKMNGATALNSASAVYVPRWKRDPNVKPAPFTKARKGKAHKPKGPKLKAGEYHISQIAEKLGIDRKNHFHSFVVSRQEDQRALPNSPENDSPISPDESSALPMGKEVLSDMPLFQYRPQLTLTMPSIPYRHAILNYSGANPPSTEPGTHIIWTRHNVETIRANVGQVYPYFAGASFSQAELDQNIRVFTFDGHYRIDAADFATKEEVIEFLRVREQSKGDRSLDLWLNKINGRWLKVVLRKAEGQTGNPME